MSSPTMKIHLHLKSVMRDAYDSYHTCARSSLDVAPGENVESFKAKCLANLGEFAEIRDVHHTKCRFTCGSKIIGPEDDSKSVSELGLQENAELHVILPIGHDSILSGEKSSPSSSSSSSSSSSAAATSATSASSSVSKKEQQQEPASPGSPRVKIHLHLKSEIRDSYDGITPAGSADIDLTPKDTVEDFKTKAFSALCEFEQLRDVHHTKCKFLCQGHPIGSELDSKKVSEVPQLKEGAEIHILLPYGHDSALVQEEKK